jgi:hypothetical protein
MARYLASGTSAAALANGNAIAVVTPAAAIACRIVRVTLGVVNAGGTPTDFQVGVGINRVTARGTATTTLAGVKSDPDSAASGITGVDSAWSVQPTLAAADAATVAYNTRGGADMPFALNDLMSTVGTANGIALVNRSGAALPASHQITFTIEWEE